MRQSYLDSFIEIIKENLAGYAADKITADEVNWYDLERFVYSIMQDGNATIMLHKVLQPFYYDYLYGKKYTCQYRFHSFICHVISNCKELGKWFYSDGNLIEMIDGLATSKVSSYSVFSRLEILMSNGYRQYANDFDIQHLNDEIARQQVQKELSRGEYLCILHAFMMIESTDIADKRKDELETLVQKNWVFLRNVYSIMVGSVIGTKQKTFTSVCNNVKMLVESHPYLHLFMGAIMAREESVMPTEEEKKKMEKHIMYLENIISETPQEDTLDELCCILFGKDFEKAVAQKKYVSYQELEGLVQHWQKMATDLGEQMKEFEPLKSMCQSMMEALQNAIPVEEICNAILGFDHPKVSEFVFYKLDWDLEDNTAWASKRKEMKNLIKAKLAGPEQYRNEMIRIAQDTNDAVKNQKPSIIGQMNLGNGTQVLPSEITKTIEKLGGDK